MEQVWHISRGTREASMLGAGITVWMVTDMSKDAKTPFCVTNDIGEALTAKMAYEIEKGGNCLTCIHELSDDGSVYEMFFNSMGQRCWDRIGRWTMEGST